MASKLARRCLVQISYAIGVAQPLSIHVDTYGTGVKPDKEILASVTKAFDFRPGTPRVAIYFVVRAGIQTWDAKHGSEGAFIPVVDICLGFLLHKAHYECSQ